VCMYVHASFLNLLTDFHEIWSTPDT